MPIEDVNSNTLPDLPLSSPNSDDPAASSKPLTSSSFTGMLNTSDARVEHNYRYTPISSESGFTNASASGDIYQKRLQAQLALNQRSADEGHRGKQWNERRQAAIARGEDPNAALLAMIEARKSDSYLERGWRKLRGKKATKKEEKEERARREAERELKGGGKSGDGDGDGDGIVR